MLRSEWDVAVSESGKLVQWPEYAQSANIWAVYWSRSSQHEITSAWNFCGMVPATAGKPDEGYQVMDPPEITRDPFSRFLLNFVQIFVSCDAMTLDVVMTQQDQAREHRNREGELCQTTRHKRSNQCTDNRSSDSIRSIARSVTGTAITPVRSQPMGAMAPKASNAFSSFKSEETGQMCPRQAAMAISPSQKG